jgi:short-subunit dehydrogenase
MSKKLKVIITGATHGIGAAIAMKYATQGAYLVIASRNNDELLIKKKELLDAGACEVVTICCDLSVKEAVRDFATKALAILGGVDVLINNVGVYLQGNILSEPENQLENMMQLNLYAPYHITRIIAPKMIEQKSGHIFNMCSVASLKAYNGGGTYSISKYALLGFSDNLRQELMPYQVKVTAVCPGATHSRSWEGASIDTERIMPASDIAELVWCASQLSISSNVEQIVIRPQFGDL